MVTKIKAVKNINRAIYYNEHKVREGAAECLYARNFHKDVPQLSLLEKKEWFHRILTLNQQIGKPALHIPVSFAPGENIAREKLIQIAREYMDRIGFGKQPYLIYYHTDTAVPHLHIVTTTIQLDGSSIDIGFIGRDKSEPARIAIEEKFGLVKAQRQKKQREFQLHPLPVEKLQYGKRPTKQAITNVLAYVLEKYRYRSLPELNAVLRLYNLRADSGRPGSRVYQHKGLVYQMINEKGEGVGIPIKASSIYFKPTLTWLEGKFRTARAIQPAELDRIRQAIDTGTRMNQRNWTGFETFLRSEQITPVPYTNRQRVLYGLSFVDLKAHLVVKASDLGKGYSSTALLRKLQLDNSLNPVAQQPTLFPAKQDLAIPNKTENLDQNEAIEILFRTEEQAERLPYELTQKANKKKKDSSKHL